MEVTRVIEHIEQFEVCIYRGQSGGYGFESTPDGRITHAYWPSLNYAIAGYCEGYYDNVFIADYSRDLKHYEGTCDCGEELIAYGGYDEFECEKCGAEYNVWGQRLRSNWRNNPSNWNDEIDDMTGYELEMAGDE